MLGNRALVTIVGYVILLCDVTVVVKYLAVFIAVTGVNAATPAAITWVGTQSFIPSFLDSLLNPSCCRHKVLLVCSSLAGAMLTQLLVLGQFTLELR
jgi:hypothetical protein